MTRPLFHLHTPRQIELWRALFTAALPECTVTAGDEPVDDAKVEYLAAWQPPAGLFGRFPRLKAVFALGAGVDRFLDREDLAPEVQLIRLTDAGMAQQMIEYVLAGVLHFQRGFDVYAAQQAQGRWQPQPFRLAAQTRVGVLGLGEIGGAVARALRGMGYDVAGWSRTPRTLDGMVCHHGDTGLATLLARTDILVNLLPNTPQTRGLLNAERLARLPAGSALVNAGRGETVDEAALLAALEGDHLRGAWLDVLVNEPAAPEHPFWRHPKVVLTPHIAAMTLPEESVAQIAAKWRALARGETVPGEVRRHSGY
ncbi:glyoxylate/hydroxypyruvate reductase A [Chitinimonas sp. BJYL2]|uniref:2-hydroxyacid dehydrogenase n=1 Tax=Chitinimonas sp. BJYL2 TaxID=2976696 RepID=UPI0022B32E4C|nr:glyoxylate/hydroxypyruvate reductase A [Chitinimonas sp. BJYL2]